MEQTTAVTAAVKPQWTAAFGITTTIIGAVIATTGLGLAFGGYKTKVDVHEQKIQVLESNMIRRDEFNAVQANISEIRQDVKELLKSNSNTKRQR